MPQSAAQIDFTGSVPMATEVLRLDAETVNSTITTTVPLEEPNGPQTGLTVFVPISPPGKDFRSKLKLFRTAYSFKAQVTVLVPELKEPEYRFFRWVSGSTAVLPEPISVNWRNLSEGGISEKIYNRLLELAVLHVGWNGPGSLSMKPSSLWSFISFWKEVRSLAAEPELVLTPSGHVQAEWWENKTHYLEIDFRSNSEKSFFALIDGRRSVLEGAAPIHEIRSIIESHRNGVALRWTP